MTVVFIPSTSYAEDAHAEVAAPPASITDNLTLELQGVSILDVFKILSKKSGLNIVAGKNVQGQVSMFLQDVPVREALRTILQSQNLASIEEGKIIKVMTEEEYLKKYGRPYEDKRISKSFRLKYASAEMLSAKLSEIKSDHGRLLTEPRTNAILVTEIPEILQEMDALVQEADQPQETEVFKLRFAKAEDLEPKLKSFMEGSAGKIEIDKRSNSIVIVDIQSRIEKIGSVIESLDSPVSQVLIEAKIVEVNLTDAYRQGINWQEIIEKVSSFDTIAAAAPLAVSPPAGATALTTLAFGSGQDDLQIVLSLLERVGKTNLL